MCGRYVVTSSPQLLAERFEVDDDQVVVSEPEYNIAPRAAVMVVRERQYRDDRDGTRRTRVLSRLRWGLVPGWAKDPSVGDRMINVRSEGLADRKSLRSTLARRRCIIPADGFYEWAPTRPRKQPVFTHRRDGAPMAFAGLWSVWKIPAEHPLAATEPDGWLRSCTILTTRANALLSPIHPRMPVLLDESSWAQWLNPTFADPDEVDGLLGRRNGGQDGGLADERARAELELWPVSDLVNRAVHNAAELIAPIVAALPTA